METQTGIGSPTGGSSEMRCIIDRIIDRIIGLRADRPRLRTRRGPWRTIVQRHPLDSPAAGKRLEGRFELGGLAPGIYTIHAASNDLAQVFVEDVEAGETSLTVRLAEGVTIRAGESSRVEWTWTKPEPRADASPTNENSNENSKEDAAVADSPN